MKAPRRDLSTAYVSRAKARCRAIPVDGRGDGETRQLIVSLESGLCVSRTFNGDRPRPVTGLSARLERRGVVAGFVQRTANRAHLPVPLRPLQHRRREDAADAGHRPPHACTQVPKMWSRYVARVRRGARRVPRRWPEPTLMSVGRALDELDERDPGRAEPGCACERWNGQLRWPPQSRS
jgi:hypothetical protein